MLEIFFSLFFLLSFSFPSRSQENPKNLKVTVSFDTINVKKGTWFNYKGKTYKILKDTVFVVQSIEIPAINVKNEQRSKIFYDSVYKKFSRKKILQMLYGLAFKPPEITPLPDNSHKIKSEVPFNKYKGKVIRHIRIETLDPFGTSIYDTLSDAKTASGKALNAAHMKTRSWVIRKNLFIKEGQKVDPYLLADNERNIRDMSSIDDVKTYIIVPDPSNDSVDIIIVTKDVFSIGFDVVTASPSNVSFRFYDGNFLGLGDKLSTNYSFKTERQSFFRLDGASYSYSNIAGTFLNALVTYTLDDMGNQNLGISCNRNFYSIKTKWAFGAGYQYTKMILERSTSKEENKITDEISYFNDMSLWGGRAFQIRNATIPTRFVITESFFRRSFSSRPRISIDSNRVYYNTTRILTGLAFSSNDYYLTDYILHFGKPENIPYGKAFKVTLGPEISDFYTRFYGGIDVSAGDYINGFGFLSGSAVLGGYLYHKSMEDCVLKMSLKYLSPLWVTPDKKFKFRSYFFSDYRFGFNFRKNNTDYSNINRDFLIDQVKYDTLFYGRKSLSASLSVIMYTPLYFYGFRFAFMLQGKGGFVAAQAESLFHQPFYTGVGLGILIRNDNLIFPPFLISCFYYPSVPYGVPRWQFRFDQNTGITLPDFNVTMPQIENLQN
ncbi:MAG: hypothetical protein ABSE72_06985 [Bacteroidales bacterium]